MAKKSSKSDELQPIIIKKVKKTSPAGHHGGAWKVAYADFVTAMMAFFLLLWLLNVAVDEDLFAIASYYDPAHPRIAKSVSGAGGIMGGKSISAEGAMVTDIQRITGPQSTGSVVQKTKIGETGGDSDYTENINIELEALEDALKNKEKEKFETAKKELEKALLENETLKALAENLDIDITDEGLRIQLLDKEGRSMFPIGSADMHEHTKLLIAEVSKVIKELHNDISIRGHTDSHKYSQGASYTNWELSADRANSSRRELLLNNIQSDRIANVIGKADKEPYNEEDLFDPSNRRISIVLLHDNLQNAMKKGVLSELGIVNDKNIEIDKLKDTSQESDQIFKKTPGEVYFP